MTTAPLLVSVPPDVRYTRIVRTVASAAATEIGMDVDRLDDLALAIDEACATVLRIPGTTSIECSLRVSDAALAVRLRGIGAEQSAWPPAGWRDSLEGIVLQGVTDGLTLTLEEGHPAIMFTLSTAV